MVFLTFDDGPETGITDFVLDELKKYDYKATFFCRGDNAEKNKELFERIKKEGHSIGNHTYSHINCFETSKNEYLADIEHANEILKCHLFRPPWGDLTLPVWIRLLKKYKIVYWNLESGDTGMERLNKDIALGRLFSHTHRGDVVLFHNCQRHAKETRILLPEYLQWLYSHNYKSLAINDR